MRAPLSVVALPLLAMLAPHAKAQAPDAGMAERWREKVREARTLVTDPQDGQFDLSAFLESAAGFLPIPLIVTEPAVGYGGGIAAVFLRPRRHAGSEGYARPDISGIGGIATENGTRVAFAGDSTRWLDGRLKTLAGALGGNVNLDVYGLGSSTRELDEAIRYTLDLKGAMASFDWQLAPKSPWYAGLRFVYADVEPKLRDEPRFPGLEDRVRSKIVGPVVSLTYDSRDNVLTPTRGAYAETTLLVSDEAFGANRDFTRFGQALIGYWPLGPKVTLAARADYHQSSDGAPFFLRPFIAMRGIPAMRYPGNKVLQGEIEARWQFHGRWSVVGFGGVGQARLDEGLAQRDKAAGAAGLGFRYELARKFGLHAGLDVARGPEETAVYLQVGSAWFRP